MLSKGVEQDPKHAYELGERITRKLIRSLQSLPARELADQGAANLWDEVCVHTRRESPWADVHRDEVEKKLVELVGELATAERVALWLATFNGQCLIQSEDEVSLTDLIPAVREQEIVSHLLSKHVAYEMMNYDNARIRKMTGE